MALNNVPLEDAGGDYYARQFGSRVQNIRKYGATAPAARKAGCLGAGGGIGGGVFAVFVVVRIIIAVAVGIGDSSYNNSYNSSYNNYSAPSDNDDAPPVTPDWMKDLQANPPVQDPAPLFPPAGDPPPPLFQPNDFRQDPPVVEDPKPPVAPDDEDKLPGKDD